MSLLTINKMLYIKNLFSSIDTKEILKGINLSIKPREIHAIMGPNGAGKTTLVMSLMGHPGYNIKSQNHASPAKRGESNLKFQIEGTDMIQLTPEERAKTGLFVAFQHPIEITGVSVLSFLRTAYKALHPTEKIPLSEFKKHVADALQAVQLDESFMQRSINEGFSGGEKKRAEIVQLLVLKPKFAILDEIDSGLDIDSLKIVARAIQEVVKKYNMGVLMITHYQRILHYVKPTHIHILVDGRIKKSGGMDLVRKIEKEGYAAV